jgi:hypothetical protein
MTRLIVLVVALLIPTGVFAKSDCSPDIEKFCKDVKERSQVGSCLDEHSGELSAACKAQRVVFKSCSQDVEKFCSDIKKQKEVSACLDKHETELSPGCKDSRAAVQ